MNYGKVDGPLAAALADISDADERALSVFIHLEEPGEEGLEALAQMGIRSGAAEPTCTATLSAREVADLSDRPWVSRLRLSARLRLC